MTDRIKWGVLGNALIARKCVIPAIQKSRNGRIQALATRSPATADEVAQKNRIGQIADGGVHVPVSSPQPAHQADR